MDYRNSGIDIKAGYASIELMRQYIKRMSCPEMIEGVGGFSGTFSLAGTKNMEDPVFPPGTSGVGTKSKIAFSLDRHDTISIDCVVMCVNDVAYAGGKPLFFPGYIAYGENIPEKIATIVSGVAEGCVQTDCTLVGGKITEHPGFMSEGKYDLVGLSVDACDRKSLITGEELEPGDVLAGIASGGVHSNGFSLVRNIFEMSGESLIRFYPKPDAIFGEVPPVPTHIYVRAPKSTKEAGVCIRAYSHTAGGGLYESVPHMLRGGVYAEIRRDSYEAPAIFRLMTGKGGVSEHVICNTFSMGVDMAVAVDPADAEKTIEVFRVAGEKSFVIGECRADKKGVDLC